MAWLLRTNLKGPSPISLARLSAPISTASASNWSTVFSVGIAARQCVSFQAWLYFSAAGPSTGLVTTVSGPGGPAAVIHNLLVGEGPTSLRNLTATAYDVPLRGTGSAGETLLLAQVSGTVENGATSGNLLLRFRSEVGGNAVTVTRGSWWQVLQHPASSAIGSNTFRATAPSCHGLDSFRFAPRSAG